jgi:hypothetical protein
LLPQDIYGFSLIIAHFLMQSIGWKTHKIKGLIFPDLNSVAEQLMLAIYPRKHIN